MGKGRVFSEGDIVFVVPRRADDAVGMVVSGDGSSRKKSRWADARMICISPGSAVVVIDGLDGWGPGWVKVVDRGGAVGWVHSDNLTPGEGSG